MSGRLNDRDQALADALDALDVSVMHWEEGKAALVVVRAALTDATAALEAAEAEREQWKRHAATSDKEVAALRTTVLTIIEALDVIPAVAPSLLWSEALPAILKRIEQVVDAANDDHAKRESAEADARQKAEALERVLRTHDCNCIDCTHARSLGRA